jgi:monofunctional biosynthetic peptidoglycan transglycosylase
MVPRGSKRATRHLLSTIRRILVRTLLIVAVLAVVPILPILALRWIPPPTSSVMAQRRVQSWWSGRDYRVDYRWVHRKRISPQAALAFIAAEDQNFETHHGFDLKSIQKAMDAHERGRRLRGASTLSQQVAKNLFLWSGRSFVRKGLEAYFTVLIEVALSKRRILEVYLNIVELGDGVFGVEAASRRYFNKSAASLSAEEAALLAAVLPNPLRLRADRPSAYVNERRAWILQQMEQLGGTALIKSF